MNSTCYLLLAQKKKPRFQDGIYFIFLGPAPTGKGTITLDPTFESFTLLEPVSLKLQNFWESGHVLRFQH